MGIFGNRTPVQKPLDTTFFGCRLSISLSQTGVGSQTTVWGNRFMHDALNGKKSAPGTLTSPTLSGGISKISFNTGFAFSDSQYSLTVNIKQNGEVVATKTFTKTGLAKGSVESESWVLDTAVEGEFVLEIINDCISGQDKNKDRVSIWNLTWENA